MHGRFTDKLRLEASEYHDAHLDGIFAKDATLKDFLVSLSATLLGHWACLSHRLRCACTAGKTVRRRHGCSLAMHAPTHWISMHRGPRPRLT
jgi:hypothetical protein